MFWMRRPPYVAWLLGSLLVIVAVISDLRTPPQRAYPFAQSDIAIGDPVDPDLIEWRDLPDGSLPVVEVEGAVAGRPIGRGEPITPSAISREAVAPSGSWAVPLDLPAGAHVGDAVRLVATDPPLAVDGVVVEPSPGDTEQLDPFAPSSAGLVAVPENVATAVAAAILNGDVLVLIAPPGGLG
jgi:hypothetical protein